MSARSLDEILDELHAARDLALAEQRWDDWIRLLRAGWCLQYRGSPKAHHHPDPDQADHEEFCEENWMTPADHREWTRPHQTQRSKR